LADGPPEDQRLDLIAFKVPCARELSTPAAYHRAEGESTIERIRGYAFEQHEKTTKTAAARSATAVFPSFVVLETFGT